MTRGGGEFGSSLLEQKTIGYQYPGPVDSPLRRNEHYGVRADRVCRS